MKVEVEVLKYASSGPRYRVICQGQTLVEGSRTPAFAACRALLAGGITGTLVVYSLGGAEPRLRVDIAKGAALNIAEGAKTSPQLVPFREFSQREEEREAA